MDTVEDLAPEKLASLLLFYADAGVEWLVEEEPVDRFAQFAARKAAQAEDRNVAAVRQASTANGERQPSRTRDEREVQHSTRRRPDPAARTPSPIPFASVSVPDGEAVSAARFAAESARSLPELKTAVEAFNGCNLKNGARNTVFASGDFSSGIMVIGPMPNADDDRDGLPFSGRQGQLLDRMIGAIGLSRDNIMLTNVIPWRPPGNRMPSDAELEICRPFLERLVALSEPKLLLLLGNFPARLFLGAGTIHSLRGQWREVAVGGITASAMATLHPQELLAAPANKALAWQDLLMFNARLGDLTQSNYASQV